MKNISTFQRVCSLSMAFALMVSSTSVLEVTAEGLAPDGSESFVFNVHNIKDSPVKGAKVTLKNDDLGILIDRTTDENGTVEFPEFEEWKNSDDALILDFEVSKNGYKSSSDSIDVSEENTRNVILSALDSVDFSDVTVQPYNAPFNDEENDAVAVISNDEDCTVKYNIDGGDFSEEVPSVKDTGTYKVGVRLSKSGYKTSTKYYTAVVEKGERELSFKYPDPSDIIFDDENETVFENPIEGTFADEVTYSSDNDDVATVDEDGTVTFKKAGTVKITATAEENDSYKAFSASYKITALESHDEIYFDISEPMEKVYQPDMKFQNTARYGDEKLKYSIIKQTLDGKEITDGAEIDSESGELTVNSAGEFVVKAESSSDSSAYTEYTLIVNRADQPEFVYSDPSLTVKCGATLNKAILNKVSSGELTYSVQSGGNVVSVDKKEGLIEPLQSGGKALIVVKIAGDNKYNEKISTFEVETKKGVLGIRAAKDTCEIKFGSSQREADPGFTGKNDDAADTVFSCSSDDDIAEIDPKSGKLTINNKLALGDYIVTITAKAENYEDKVFKIKVSVVMNESADVIDIKGTEGENGWYTSYVTISPKADYEGIAYGQNDVFQKELILEDGIHKNDVFGKRKSDESIEKDKNGVDVKIDTVPPEVVNVTCNGETLDNVDDLVTSKGNISIGVSAMDNGSGIEKFVFKLGGTKTEISTDSGSDNIEVLKDGTVNAKLDIAPERVSSLEYKIVDRAGNSTEWKKTSKNFVSDNTKPEITFDGVEKDKDKVAIGSKTVTIRIEEPNIKTLSGGNIATVNIEKDGEEYNGIPPIKFVEQRKNTGIYTANVTFKEVGNYRINVSCEDICGNSNSAVSDEDGIIVGEEKPSTSVEFNSTNEADIYGADRTAAVEINSQYVDFGSLKAVCEITTLDGTKINSNGLAEELTKKLSDKTLWKHDEESGTYKLEGLKFDVEGNYKFYINYGDKTLTETFSFCIDKSEPTDLGIEYKQKNFDTFLETITFGFYKPDVDVTLKASDNISGIAEFEYWTVDSDGNESEHITIKNSSDGVFASYTFNINKTYKGKIHFIAKDKAGRVCNSEENLVIEETPPVIELSTDKVSNKIGEVKIKITEENFDPTKTKIELFDRDLNSKYEPVKNFTPEFTSEEGSNVHTAVVTIDKAGIYKLVVDSTDKAGNEAEQKYIEFSVVENLDESDKIIQFEGDNDKKYFDNTRNARLCINAESIDVKLLSAKVTAVDVNGNEVADQDHRSIAEKLQADFNDMIQDPDNWRTEGTGRDKNYYLFYDKSEYPLEFTASANYTLEISYNGKKADAKSFCVDKESPVDLNITYDTSSFVINKLLNELPINFFNDSVDVTITASDRIAGISKLDYDYVDVNGNGIGNNSVVENSLTTYADNSIVSYTFTLEPQFKGKIKLTAYDKSNNSKTFNKKDEDGRDIVDVVDNERSVIDVSYDNNSAENDDYYKSPRTATITIQEDNFYSENVKVTVSKREFGNSEFVDEVLNDLKFKHTEGNVYTAKVTFDEDCEYKLYVEAKDYSGHTSTYSDSFMVDKIKPVIDVTYDNNSAENENYYKSSRTAEIKITEDNFSADNVEIIVERRANDSSEYISSTVKPDFTSDGNIHTMTYTFSDDADYKFSVKCTDLAGNEQEEAYSTDFTVDNIKPVINVTYDNNSAENGNYYKSSRTATIKINEHNFYANGVKIVVEKRANNSSSYTSTVVKPDFTSNGDIHTMTYTFSDNADYKFSVECTDLAGNEQEEAYSTDFTVDKIKPVVNVTYDNNSAENGNYYKSSRTATIKINEHNFYANGVKIVVEKRANNSSSYTSTVVNPDFTSNGDIHTMTYTFSDDADYKFSVECTDLAGNEQNAVYKDEFTVDKTKPVINVTYDNNSASNSRYFKAARTATIKVTEHNFDTKNGSKLTVTAKDASGRTVKTYADSITSWTKSGDVYTAKVEFKDDANYTFDFAYTDMAGNTSGRVNYGSSKAPESFTVDTVKPQGTVKIGSLTSDSSFRNSYDFTRWSNRSQEVSITDSDTLSGIDHVEYLRTDKIYNETQAAKAAGWMRADNLSTSFSISPDEKVIIYVHIVDKAGNETYISSNGVIFDATKPVVEKEAPQIKITPGKTSFSGVFNSDVPFDIRVVDPSTGADVYSGLSSVTYEVINMGTVTSSGTLFRGGAEMTKVYDKTAALTINSAANNSNDVTLRIYASDNAGNSSAKNYDLSIDITKPSIRLSYDNNSVRNDKYFKNDRTAVIEVTERNFSADDIKIDIKNSEGSVPRVSGWTQVSSGSGNGDNAVWRTTVKFDTDGKYNVNITGADKAGNSDSGLNIVSGTAAAKDFVIDKTAPELTVSYDNNSAQHGNYYDSARKATITIKEHNFSKNDASVSLTARLDGKDISKPKQSDWSGSNDSYVSTIEYKADGDYTFGIKYTDLAGNEIKTYADDSFHIDTVKPVVKISGVEDKAAYSSKAAPEITFSDINFNADSISVTLTGANKGEVKNFKYTVKETKNGVKYVFDNIEEIKDNDDIYTLTAVTKDMAGNENEKAQVVFSVNRFGSTYELDSATGKLNNSFIKEPQDVVISEYNANKLADQTITIVKNEKVITLVKDKDYSVSVEGGDGKWYKYIYTIFKSNFEDDGIYSIKVHSVDEAGNVAENTLDTKVTDISFAVDKTPPEIIVTNLESNKTYPVTKLDVRISASDNIQLSSVQVMLDGKEAGSWNEAETEKILSANGDFIVSVDGNSTSAHTMKIICTDKAGNTSEAEFTDFYVTTNFWVRFYNNKPAFFGTLGGILLLIAAVVFVIVKKKRR